MQTIVRKISRLDDAQSILVLISNEDKINIPFLSKEQINYCNNKFRDKDKDMVELNLFTRFVFIYKPKKEDNIFRSLDDRRKTGDKITKTLNEQKLSTIQITGEKDSGRELLAIAEGIGLSNYQFIKYKSKSNKQSNNLKFIHIVYYTI